MDTSLMPGGFSLYGNYDDFMERHSDDRPCVRGGKKRARTADRDRNGVMMPNDFAAQLEWMPDEKHGVAGGTIRAATALRGHLGHSNWFAPNPKKEKETNGKAKPR